MSMLGKNIYTNLKQKFSVLLSIALSSTPWTMNKQLWKRCIWLHHF